MFSLILARKELWSYRTADGGTITFYFDELTWIVAAFAAAWVVWLLVRRYLLARRLKRSRGRNDYRALKQIVKLKHELSSRYLQPGFSRRIHAVGIGLMDGSDEYCIQVFINDGNDELWSGAVAETLPANYRGAPVVPIEMPNAGFLSEQVSSDYIKDYAGGIREYQDVIIGGISGANTNLNGQSGTIGYFCTRRSRLPRRKEIHLLSNSHVFVDLRKAKVDDDDLIMQPSPGEPGSNRPIGTLVDFAPLKFEGDMKEPNHVDAAIAKLWGPQRHSPLIPMIGAVKGYVEKKDIEIGEAVRKFGRTTGYTEGQISSIYLDIWIRYDRTGQSAFFQNQLLIEPAAPNFTRFVSKGDSGSLVVDARQHAVGLIFGGRSDAPQTVTTSSPVSSELNTANKPKRIEGYGVANPISDVLNRLKIDLVV